MFKAPAKSDVVINCQRK